MLGRLNAALHRLECTLDAVHSDPNTPLDTSLLDQIRLSKLMSLHEYYKHMDDKYLISATIQGGTLAIEFQNNVNVVMAHIRFNWLNGRDGGVYVATFNYQDAHSTKQYESNTSPHELFRFVKYECNKIIADQKMKILFEFHQSLRRKLFKNVYFDGNTLEGVYEMHDGDVSFKIKFFAFGYVADLEYYGVEKSEKIDGSLRPIEVFESIVSKCRQLVINSP